MYRHLRDTAKKYTQQIIGSVFTLLVACTIYAPWEIIGYTTSVAERVMSESNASLMPFAYASSYSNAITVVTANGKTVITKSSDSDPTSSSVSIVTVVNGTNGADGRDGTPGADGANGIPGADGRDGTVLSSDADTSNVKDVDEVRIQILRTLIEKLNQLLALLREAN